MTNDLALWYTGAPTRTEFWTCACGTGAPSARSVYIWSKATIYGQEKSLDTDAEMWYNAGVGQGLRGSLRLLLLLYPRGGAEYSA